MLAAGDDSDHSTSRLPPLARRIIALLVTTPIPLSPFRMAPLLGLPVMTGEAEILFHCRRLHRVLGHWVGSYYLLEREPQMIRNALVSDEYQRLGMTVLTRRPSEPPLVWIPPLAEARFFDVKQSGIRGAGLGLFLRPQRMVRQGTLLCEYRGRCLSRLPKDASFCPYTVRVHGLDGVESFIDGIDEEGSALCLAALINDGGVDRANVELCEVPAHRGRVFVMALRDLENEEELFVSYGSAYWEVVKGKKVVTTVVHSLAADVVCRQCETNFPVRLRKLHKATCGDALLEASINQLDSLPVNDFTAVDDEMLYLTHRRVLPPALRYLEKRATYFVSNEDSATFAHTHVDIVTLKGIEVVDE